MCVFKQWSYKRSVVDFARMTSRPMLRCYVSVSRIVLACIGRRRNSCKAVSLTSLRPATRRQATDTQQQGMPIRCWRWGRWFGDVMPARPGWCGWHQCCRQKTLLASVPYRIVQYFCKYTSTKWRKVISSIRKSSAAAKAFFSSRQVIKYVQIHLRKASECFQVFIIFTLESTSIPSNDVTLWNFTNFHIHSK